MEQFVLKIKTTKAGEVVFSDIIKSEESIEVRELSIDGLEHQVPMSIKLDKVTEGLEVLITYTFFRDNYPIVIRAISKLSSELMREVVKIDKEAVTVIKNSLIPIYESVNEICSENIGIAETMSFKMHVLGLYTLHDRLLGIKKPKRKSK